MSQAVAAKAKSRAMGTLGRNAAVNWGTRMRKPGFQSGRFKRLAWGDGDAYPYTPRCKFRYLWEDWPTWQRTWFMGMLGMHTIGWVWYWFCVYPTTMYWNEYEALRRGRLRREAQELMILEGVEYGHNDDRQPDRA